MALERLEICKSSDLTFPSPNSVMFVLITCSTPASLILREPDAMHLYGAENIRRPRHLGHRRQRLRCLRKTALNRNTAVRQKRAIHQSTIMSRAP